jgi:uncharacterized protein (DUF1330 family)
VPKAYWIATYRSAKLSADALTSAGGKIVVRDVPAATLEAGLKQRTVLEFESVQSALDAYNSPAYQAALKVLGEGSAERDIRIVEAS